MINKIRRFFMRQRWMRDYEKSLNTRAAVEQELFDMANGSMGLPDKDKCRELALKLGAPDKWR